jgi:general stress protein CsbA
MQLLTSGSAPTAPLSLAALLLGAGTTVAIVAAARRSGQRDAPTAWLVVAAVTSLVAGFVLLLVAATS